MSPAGPPADSRTAARPTATCQLARRARQKIEAQQGTGDSPRSAGFNIGALEHRQVTAKFIAACATGDLDGLLEVLAADAWGDFGAGPGDARSIGVIAAPSG